MRKVFMLAALVAAAASFLVVGVGTAAHEGAEVIEEDVPCTFKGFAGSGGFNFAGADATRQTVTTPSGGALTTCKGQLPTTMTPPKKAMSSQGSCVPPL